MARLLDRAGGRQPHDSTDLLSAYIEAIRDEGLRVFEGARALLWALSRQQVRYGLGSPACRVRIEASLRAAGLHGAFAVAVSGDEVASLEPVPDVPLAVAHALDVEPSQCVVIESCPAGIQAAHRAGMACVAVTTSFARAMLGEADLIVDSLLELSVPMLRELVDTRAGDEAARSD